MRNRRRASIALATVVAAVVALMLAEGFVAWIFWAMREATIHSQFGHIQVVQPGYEEAGVADPFAYLLPENSPLEKQIEKMPGVDLIAERLSLSGMISRGDTTVSFLGEGVEPGKEVKLSRALRIVSGRGLSHAGAPDEREVVLGRGLARNLNAKPGDSVVLLANSESGGINAIELRVVGLFVSVSKAYDDAALRLPISQARTLLRTSGSHSWLILLTDTESTGDMLRALRARFHSERRNVKFIPWYARADFYRKTVKLLSEQMGAVELIIALIVVLSISNVLVMNVLERTGEIGTLMAIGLKRKTILRLFLWESSLLGLIGAILGLGIGAVLAWLISIIGIPMPPPPGMDKGYTGQILLTWGIVANAFLLAWVTTSIAGVYPAWKASRLEIVDALRHSI